MAQLFAIAACLGSIVWALYSPVWSWSPLVLAACFLVVSLAGVKGKKWKHIDELSPVANALFQKFGHYYMMPFAGRSFSGAASTIQFGALAVAAVGAFQGFWWGLAIAVLFWFGMGAVAATFNPTNFLRDPAHQMAHEEIITWISEQNERRRRDA